MAQQEEKEKPTSTTVIITPPHHHHHHHDQLINHLHLQEKEIDKDFDIAISSRVLCLLGDITSGPAYRFAQWLDSIRKKGGGGSGSGGVNYHRSSNRSSPRLESMILSNYSAGAGEEAVAESKSTSQQIEQVYEISLWERLGKAAMLDIESTEFSWEMLSSLHRSEHSSSTEHSEDEMNKALEVTVNSGGVVFFALFNKPANDESVQVESAAVIKIASSRMATQSERLGYEFAKRLGVRTPQAKVVHNCSPEWQQIKDATEKARDAAVLVGDDAGEVTCSELLEALELSRCLFLMKCKQNLILVNEVLFTSAAAAYKKKLASFLLFGLHRIYEGMGGRPLIERELLGGLAHLLIFHVEVYVHGSPLLESSRAFDSWEAAEKTAAALGRILMLDLVIRNEDRLPCRQLRWRGNSANLLLSAKAASEGNATLDEVFGAATRRFGPSVIKTIQKERRSISVDGRLNDCDPELMPQSSDVSYLMGFRKTTNWNLNNQGTDESESGDFDLVAIDSCIPRRPPAGKRTNDQVNYPKLVELLLHSAEYSSSLLYGITGGKVGYPLAIEADEEIDSCLSDSSTVVNEFRSGFRTALRDLQSFYIFLLTLYQKLDSHLRNFLTIINKNSLGDIDKDDCLVPESPSHAAGVAAHCLSPVSKERSTNETHTDLGDMELQRTIPRSSPPGNKESQDSASPATRENWHGRCSKGNGEPLRSLRLTTKLRDFNKYAKVDAELHKELEQWNEMLRTDAIKFCQDNNFNTGFFEGSENNSVVDAYELKVRLEHILERIALISDAANTEKPSSITGNLFIGGALAARSVHTLQHLGITHILCLCSNEIGQSDSQYPDLFEYKNFSICDSEDTNISNIFEEATDYIEKIERSGGKVLVHCFEGKSRSATVVLAYLMLRKNFTLSKAWNILKKAHRRAQPNDGFAKTLLDLDMQLHGKVSMEWQQRKPMMKVCPICGKNAGLSSSSLNLHLQKSHRKIISSGSVDSAMNMEIQKAVSELKISTSGNVSPTTQKMDEGFNQ